MFVLQEFIKEELIRRVGKTADYQILLNAAGWLEKGVLTKADLLEIQKLAENRVVSAKAVSE